MSAPDRDPAAIYDVAFIQVYRAVLAANTLSYVPEDIRTHEAPEAALLRIALVAPDLGEWWRQCDGDGPPPGDRRWDAVWAERLDQCRHVLELLRAEGLVVARAARDEGHRMSVDLTSYSYALHTACHAQAQARLYRELAEQRGETIRQQASALLTLRTHLQRHEDTASEFETDEGAG